MMIFELDALQIGWLGIISSVFAIGILIVATIWIAVKTRHQRVTTGIEVLIGAEGEALLDVGNEFQKKGQVRIGGEIWAARSSHDIQQGDRVRVVAVDDLMLEVEKVNLDAL